MSYEDRDTFGMYKGYTDVAAGPRLMGAGTLIGNDVVNHKDDDLGETKS